MTSLPASHSIRGAWRGSRKAAADLVLFDPATVKDEATWRLRKRLSDRLPMLVNGVFVVRDGSIHRRAAGQILRRTG
jgi:N-acyl-D-aspartate/D-glutamate deacylase